MRDYRTTWARALSRSPGVRALRAVRRDRLAPDPLSVHSAAPKPVHPLPVLRRPGGAGRPACTSAFARLSTHGARRGSGCDCGSWWGLGAANDKLRARQRATPSLCARAQTSGSAPVQRIRPTRSRAHARRQRRDGPGSGARAAAILPAVSAVLRAVARKTSGGSARVSPHGRPPAARRSRSSPLL
jgi:hypothetical protein